MTNPRLQRCVLAVLVSCVLAPSSLLGVVGVSAAPAPAPAPAAPAPASAAPSQVTLQQLFRQSAPAVVFITQVDGNGKVISLASGFIVSPSGVIVTNHHVIAPDQGAVELRVRLPRGDVFNDVRVIYAEERRDFAVVTVRASGLPTLKVGDSDQVEVGDQVVAIGNPQGLDLTFTQGIVESIRLDPSQGYRFIQHQAPISPGSSGGPLLNMKGEVIGINAFEFKNAQNLNGAIPINYVKPYFGDQARMTWQEFARTAAAPPAPAPAPAAPPPSPAAPPAQPAPPSGGGQPSAPGAFFERNSDYGPKAEEFRNGFAAGVFDAVSLFAGTAQRAGGIDNQQTLLLFRCLDGKGDKLGDLTRWVDSVITQGAADKDPVVTVVAKACQGSFALRSFFESVADYRPGQSDFRNGFAAGVYDTISYFAQAAQGSRGIDNQKTLTLFQCLDGKGDKLGQLTSWLDSTVNRSSSAADSVVSTVVGVCVP